MVGCDDNSLSERAGRLCGFRGKTPSVTAYAATPPSKGRLLWMLYAGKMLDNRFLPSQSLA